MKTFSLTTTLALYGVHCAQKTMIALEIIYLGLAWQAEGGTFRIAQPSPTGDKLADRLDDIVKRTCGGIQAAQLLNRTLSPPNNTHSCASRKNFFCKFSTVLSFVLTILLRELSPSKHHSALINIKKEAGWA